MSRTRARTTAVASITLGAVALLAAGAVATLVLAPQRTPASLGPVTGATMIDVSLETFDDVRQVAVTAEQASGVPLTVRGEGLVTRTSCAPGSVVTSGVSPLTVDDRVVIALATSEPLWRDLGPGAEGTDVQALQTELARLGHVVQADGAYGRATGLAVKALQRAAGVPAPTETLAAASVLWLPAEQVTIDACEVGPAELISDGTFATTTASVTALTLAEDVTGAVSGSRELRSNGAQAPVDTDGRVTDASFLAAFSSSTEWRFAQSGEGDDAGSGQVKVEFALKEPVEALVVPPAALYDLAGEEACVVGDAGGVPVRVVSSALGKSLVVTQGSAPAQVQVPPVDPAPCR